MSLLLGDLSLFIEVKAFKSSLSVIAPSHLRISFSLSLGKDTFQENSVYLPPIWIVFLVKEFDISYKAHHLFVEARPVRFCLQY